MPFQATAIFKCDGCKVIESDPIIVDADILQARPPMGWLRVQVNKLTPSMDPDTALDGLAIKFFGPCCAPLIESYLSGRKVEPEDAVAEETEKARRQLMHWKRKALAGLSMEQVNSIIQDLLDNPPVSH